MERGTKPEAASGGGILDLRGRGRLAPSSDTAARLLRELSRSVAEMLADESNVIAADCAQLAEVHYWLARSRRLDEVAGWPEETEARRTG